MSLDRIVDWVDFTPTIQQIKSVLENFVGETARVSQDQRYLYATFKGPPSFPFKGLSKSLSEEVCPSPYSDRWFEVYYGPTFIDVITRQADEFTSVLADGFAELCRRYWQGKHVVLPWTKSWQKEIEK